MEGVQLGDLHHSRFGGVIVERCESEEGLPPDVTGLFEGKMYDEEINVGPDRTPYKLQ